MSGIAGIHGKADADLVAAMLEKIHHRGPDGRREVSGANFSGGTTVSKLSDARGDGVAESDGVTVLFEGEIYNPRPDGAGDADVALEAYRKYGRAFPGTLQGVFACAVFDGEDLLLARDAVGVRPLYYGTTAGGGVAFASEMKCLVGVCEDVQELLPETTWSADDGIAGFVQHYPPVKVPSDLDDGIRAVREALTNAVKRRLEDGATGACLLSGGLDSSIIACCAYDLGAKLPLVTVGLDGAPDVINARTVAEHLGAEHHEYLYEVEDIRQAVPRAVCTLESFDEDCVSGTISNLFASGKAAEMTNCILSGEGGDELFGGYHLLKDLASESEQLKMMHRLVEVAYNTALQRLDRAMMGNSIVYRTPFIDTEVISLALQLPVRWKIRDVGGEEPVEKYILREAFRDLLPEAIYKRRKLRFAAGTGTDDRMDAVAAEAPEGGELTDANRRTPEGYTLSSPKELWYYNIFKKNFPAPCFEQLVGRWDPGK